MPILPSFLCSPSLPPIRPCTLSAALPLLTTLPAFVLVIFHLLYASQPARIVPKAVRTRVTDLGAVRRLLGWRRLFQPFLTLEEAEALLKEIGGSDDNGRYVGDDYEDGEQARENTPFLKRLTRPHDARRPLLFTLSYALLPLFEVLAWLAITTYRLALLASTSSPHPGPPYQSAIPPAILTLTHLGALLLFLATPPRGTPPYRLLVLYFLLMLGAVANLGGEVYDWKIDGMALDGTNILAQVVNLAVLGWLVCVGMSRPMVVPGPHIDRSKIVRISQSPAPLFIFTHRPMTHRASQSPPNHTPPS